MGNINFWICHTIDELKECFNEQFPYEDAVENLALELYIKFGEFIIEKVKTFIIEYPYIEKEWRELYSLHYCKTNYNKTSPFVYRIHLFDKEINGLEEITDDDSSYMGCATIRPLPTSFISKIILKKYRKFYNLIENEDLYMITAKYEVHIGTISVCAHADAMIISEIMHKRHEMTEISIERFISKIPYSQRGREIPSIGLTIEHVENALMENGCLIRAYSSSYESPVSSSKTPKEKCEELLRTLDAHVESGLPCILGFANHVIVVAGHTIDKNENDKFGYVIFDDSGHHIQKTFNNPFPLFSIVIPKKELEEELTSYLGESNNEIFLICPIFQRFYFPFESVEDEIECFQKEEGHSKKLVPRILLVDSKNLHKFLENTVKNDDYKDVAFPHYVWYVEFYSEARGKEKNLEKILIIDASAHKNDKIYSIFYTNKNKPFCAPKNKKIYTLLTEIKE
ncbi:MAG: hypothetical protein CVT88_09265 [Candidatus Altiarchaeales archaeon HGW-Altiarchaeales-1]|nr:MAG: hypothetical protein CVT88_09265 [Candidatus Altiarchaeales archaeon HGW-Altiarchaeales-1]